MMRDENEIKKRIAILQERSNTFERMNDLRMALDLIHRIDELRWVIGELDDNYEEISTQEHTNEARV